MNKEIGVWPPPPSNHTTPDDAELYSRQNEVKLRYRTRRSSLLMMLYGPLIAITQLYPLWKWMWFRLVACGCAGIVIYVIMQIIALPRLERAELEALNVESEAAGNHP